jgi:hypothetical protein
MDVRSSVLLGTLLVSLCFARANDKPQVNQVQFPPTYLPSGEVMYKQYCAADYAKVYLRRQFGVRSDVQARL